MHVNLPSWGNHNSRVYFVRSGYWWLQRPTHSTETTFRVWRTIAKLQVLPKIRVFTWRAAHGGLPVGRQLWEASIRDGLCPMCCLEEETILHALRDCLYVQATFALAVYCGFIVLLWIVWNGRNTKTYDDKLQPLWLIATNAKLLQQENLSARNNCAQTKPRHHSSARAFSAGNRTHPPYHSGSSMQADNGRWIPLVHSFVKVNVDGAFSSQQRLATVGVIARDSTGLPLRGMTISSLSCVEVGLGKIHAFVAGLKFACENQWKKVVFESDSSLVVNKLNCVTEDLSTLGFHLQI
ncbi:uncharacterized protein LOC120184223 [Hibiscus syriacus]|uniref:uncharacterized protein LOC120184223 n=1 Tax=Hibiscus syriacus TaxID=106335 RepID=UPI001920916A|nr:uncharacterized protein LOC120184223 [Hibiscus syriacus]